MTCNLDDPRDLWGALLALRAFLAMSPRYEGVVYLSHTDGAWSFAPSQPTTADVIVEVEATVEDSELEPAKAFKIVHGKSEHAALPAFLRLYLPIVLAGNRARRRARVHVTGHLAQTLDGRIACVSGDSQWIGNPGNLRHAHRLRALHDAILVGRHTVERDNPQLTVRHVAGDNPRRVVLNGSASALRRRHELQVFNGAGCVLVCGRDNHATSGSNGTEVIGLAADGDGVVSLPAVLAELAARGLHSLFIEGGGRTLSGFLAGQHVDLLHLHIAPIILGSGKPSFVLPEVARLADAQRMHARHYDVDGELLFACYPKLGIAEPRPV